MAESRQDAGQIQNSNMIYQPVSKPLKSILSHNTAVGKKSLRTIIKDVRAKAKGAGINTTQEKMAVKALRDMNAGKAPMGRRMGRLAVKALGATEHLGRRYKDAPTRALRIFQKAMEAGSPADAKPASKTRSLLGLKKEESPGARRVRARRYAELREAEEAKREEERGIVRSAVDRGTTVSHSAAAPIRSLGEQKLEAAAVSMGEVAAREREAERATEEKGSTEPQELVEMMID